MKIYINNNSSTVPDLYTKLKLKCVFEALRESTDSESPRSQNTVQLLKIAQVRSKLSARQSRSIDRLRSAATERIVLSRVYLSIESQLSLSLNHPLSPSSSSSSYHRHHHHHYHHHRTLRALLYTKLTSTYLFKHRERFSPFSILLDPPTVLET